MKTLWPENKKKEKQQVSDPGSGGSPLPHVVKDRNEVCNLVHVLEILAGARGIPVEEVSKAAYSNARSVFRLGDLGVPEWGYLDSQA